MRRYNLPIRKLSKCVRFPYLHIVNAEDKKNIENLYNDTFNCYVLREYDEAILLFRV